MPRGKNEQTNNQKTKTVVRIETSGVSLLVFKERERERVQIKHIKILFER